MGVTETETETETDTGTGNGAGPDAESGGGAGDRAALAAELAGMVDGLNIDFEDSVLFMARVLGGRPAATGARITTVDPWGLDCVVTDPAGEHRQRLAFTQEVTDLNRLPAELYTLVTRAREESGEEGMTSAERLMVEMRRVRTFLAEVTAVEDVHSHLRRITFSGDDLARFSPVGPDTFLFLLLPPPGRTELTVDRSFSWEQVPAMAEDERPVGANYTVRAWRPERNELDILFVLHEGPGPAGAWAERARPGDPVGLWGPRTAYHPPAGTDWYLLVADETGLPAVANVLETLPAGTPARVIAEVTDESQRQDLPSSPSYEVTWLHRGDRPAGTTTLLADAVRSLPMPWPDGTPYVWGAGESRAMTAVRKHVRHRVGLPHEAVSLVAYWRHAGGDGD